MINLYETLSKKPYHVHLMLQKISLIKLELWKLHYFQFLRVSIFFLLRLHLMRDYKQILSKHHWLGFIVFLKYILSFSVVCLFLAIIIYPTSMAKEMDAGKSILEDFLYILTLQHAS